MTREEAINKVRQMSLPKETMDILEALAPELAMSEDERIREGLVNFILYKAGHLLDEETEHKFIAYLEKQKDANKAIEAVERIDKYIDQHLANAHDMKDSNPDKKYYRGWDDALGKMAGILQDVYSGEKQKESLRDFIDNFPYSDEQKEPHYTKRNALFDKCVENCDPEVMKKVSDEVDDMLQNEQKPANLNLTTWHRDVVYCAMCDKNLDEGLRCNLEMVYKTIKELVDRAPVIREQKSTEWSEEDERILKGIIGLIDHDQHYGVSNNEMISWLKTLRPQPHTVSTKDATKFGNLEYKRGVKDGIQSEKSRQ